MKHLTGLHIALAKAKTTFVNSDSYFSKVDPFALLLAFVQGTGDLFDKPLIEEITHLCVTKDVKGYIELASRLDALIENYSASTDPELVKGHRVLCSFLKKYPFSAKESPYDTRAVAVGKWRAAESQCGETNSRLSQCMATGMLPEWVPHAQSFIQSVIGDLEPADIMKMLSAGHHSSGTSLDTPFEASSPYFKYSLENPSVTPNARVYMKAAMSLNNKWLSSLSAQQGDTYCSVNRAHYESEVCDAALRFQEHERISFVEKDARSMRPIGIGNSCNMYLQLGVKHLMQKRLRKAGFDLTNQQHNRDLAYTASIEGMLGLSRPDLLEEQRVTVDLASASDTVSRGICTLLLPHKWNAFLLDLRHPSGQLDDEIIVYNKMSAMGNGFTFPLETLIFASILYGVYATNGFEWNTDDIAVYGDDIICHKKAIPDLFSALDWSGFSINKEKSFTEGCFKESCGADFFQGINVRPIYLKRRIRSAKDAYHVANNLLSETLDKHSSVSQGYVAVYQTIYKIIEGAGPVMYRPLSDAYSHGRDGLVWSAHEYGLCVPLSFARKQWFNPFVNMRDLVSLYHHSTYFRKPGRKWRNQALTAMLQNPNPMFLDPVSRVRPIAQKKVNGELILLCTLDSAREETDTSMDPYRHTNADARSNGTIRPSLKTAPNYTFRVRECPSWDGYSSSLAEKHPLVG